MSAHDVHLPTREEIVAGTSRPLPKILYTVCLVLVAIGVATFLAGLFTGIEHKLRVWRALHVNWLYFTLISSAGVMLVAAQRIVTARWSRPIIRFLEGYVAFLPVAFVLLALILVAGKWSIFPWMRVAPPAPEKAIWLDGKFLILRDLFCFGVLIALQLLFVYRSLRLDIGLLPEAGASWARGLRDRMRNGYRDERRELHSIHSSNGLTAVIMALVFGYFWPVLIWDLSMTLDIHFQSTLYGWWVFMGGWLGSIMTWALLCMWWRRYLDRYDLVTENHFHDLGKLAFAFSAFWGYLTFGQYLVIWYGNLAEETHWMRLRLIDPWKPLSVAVVFMMFAIPFFGLLSRAAKVFLPTFILFALSSIVGLWFHRYLEVYPSTFGPNMTTLPLGIWELGVTLGVLGLWGFSYASFMDAFPRMRVVALTSPYRDEIQVPVDPETMEPLPAHE